ncbi:MAG: 30S ribosomal protein S6 [Candidatus Moranbacteria bacterium]|nr:30S ribosomal protein S6 [Candidatus Moranbacteria bacterium]
MQYELFYLVGERQEASLPAIKEGVNAILALEKASMVGEELSEKRKLAYEIKHQNKGTYITRRFELPEIDFWADEANAEKEFGIQAITNKLNLNNDVLRFLIVKTEDLPELGAKDRRKAKETANNAGRPAQRPQQRTERPGSNNQRPTMQRPTQRPTTPAPAAPVKKVEAAKEESKNIDKQLDELLNI